MAFIQLTQFEELAKQRGSDLTAPPYRVPSKDLDKNFKKVSPIEQSGNAKGYSISATADGWELIPEAVFYVCANGQPQRFKFVATAL